MKKHISAILILIAIIIITGSFAKTDKSSAIDCSCYNAMDLTGCNTTVGIPDGSGCKIEYRKPSFRDGTTCLAEGTPVVSLNKPTCNSLVKTTALTASAPIIYKGEQVKLDYNNIEAPKYNSCIESWSNGNLNPISIAGANVADLYRGGDGKTGVELVSPRQSMSFYLFCTGPSTPPMMSSVSVSVTKPSITISAVTDSNQHEGNRLVTWNANYNYYNECFANWNPSFDDTYTGSRSVPKTGSDHISSTTTRTYTLSCTVAGTGEKETASVTITPSIKNSFTVTGTGTIKTKGTISPASRTVSSSGVTTFTITPNTGYTASASGCGGTLSGTTYTTGPITSACTVNAIFTIKTNAVIDSYAVSTSFVKEKGTISPASRTVSSSGVTTFTITPNTGYKASASGCGGTLSGTTYTTGPITSACTVNATFTLTVCKNEATNPPKCTTCITGSEIINGICKNSNYDGSWQRVGEKTHIIGKHSNLSGDINVSLSELKPGTEYTFVAIAQDCKNGSTDVPYCTTKPNDSVETFRGDPLTFTTKGNKCANGATDYPTCKKTKEDISCTLPYVLNSNGTNCVYSCTSPSTFNFVSQECEKPLPVCHYPQILDLESKLCIDGDIHDNLFPVVNATADESLLNSGESTTIRWSSTNADFCMNGDSKQKLETSGSFDTGALTESSAYSITCTGDQGSGGDSVNIFVRNNPSNVCTNGSTNYPACDNNDNLPTVTVKANPSSLDSGKSSVVSWTSTNATSCDAGTTLVSKVKSINLSAVAMKAIPTTSGSFNTGALTASKTYSVTCIGANGTASDTVNILVNGDPNNDKLPTVTITADKSSLNSGESTIVHWESKNTTSCDPGINIETKSINLSAIAVKAPPSTTSGSFNTGALTASRAFAVTCIGEKGKVAGTINIYVNNSNNNTCTNGATNYPKCTVGPDGGCLNKATNPPACDIGGDNLPTVTVKADKSSLNSGESTIVRWESKNASSCDAGINIGIKSINLVSQIIKAILPTTSGSFDTGALTASKEFTVTCTGEKGKAAGTVNILVNGDLNNNFPIVTVTANPSSVNSGGSSIVSWTSINTTSCDVSDNNTVRSGTWNSTNWSSNDGGKSGTWNTTTDFGTWTAPLGSGGTGNANWIRITKNSGVWNKGLYFGFWTSNKLITTSGSFDTGALAESKAYTVTCTGEKGTGAGSVNILINGTNACTNSAINYPKCTVGPDGGCLNGATNPPVCNDIEGDNLPTINAWADKSSFSIEEVPAITTIHWESNYTDYCDTGINAAGISNGTGTKGSFNTDPLTKSRAYTISCTGDQGTASENVHIFIDTINPNNLIPTINVWAEPSLVNYGESTIVHWESNHTNSCEAATEREGVFTGKSGEFTTDPLTKNTSYTVTCIGDQGDVAGSTDITIKTSDICINGATNPPKCDSNPTKCTNGTTNYPVCDNNIPTGNCTDNIKNGDETSVDAGGRCSYDGTCSDKIKNSNETDVDFGGRCGNGFGGCSDGIKNSNETGIDTGGRCVDNNPVCPNNATNYPACTTKEIIPRTNNPLPSVNISASPLSVSSGGSSTISWTSNNTTSCNAGDGHGTGITGSFNTGTLAESKSFFVTCTGANGTGSDNIYVFVNKSGNNINTRDPNTNDKNTGDWSTKDKGKSGTWTTETGSGTWTTTKGTGGTDGATWASTGKDKGTWTSPTGSGTWKTTKGTVGVGNTGTWGKGKSIGIINTTPLVLGQTATPPWDAIVRYHEGIETVLMRQIMGDITFAKMYGYKEGNNLQTFAWDTADAFAKKFGYINTDRKEIRVSVPDRAAYQLQLIGDKLTIYEYFDYKIVDVRNLTTIFKSTSGYEYYFQK